MKLLSDKTGEVIEYTAKIKIIRHYGFAEEGGSENKINSSSASPGEIEAR